MGQILRDFKAQSRYGLRGRYTPKEVVYNHLIERHGIKAVLRHRIRIKHILDSVAEEIRLEAEGCGCGQPLFRHADGHLGCPACVQY